MNSSAGRSGTAELRIISIDGLKPALKALSAELEAHLGRRLKWTSHPETAKGLEEQITRGDQFDAALLTEHLLDDMIGRERIVAQSRTELCWCGLGVGVRAGRPRPDIGSREAVKQTLLDVKSITYHATGATADRIHLLFEQLGIADHMRSKAKPDPVSRGRAQKLVADGDVEMVLTLSPEVNDAGWGVEFVGPLPTSINPGCITFVGGVSPNAHDPDKAEALLKFFAAAEAGPALDALGLFRGGSRPAW